MDETYTVTQTSHHFLLWQTTPDKSKGRINIWLICEMYDIGLYFLDDDI